MYYSLINLDLQALLWFICWGCVLVNDEARWHTAYAEGFHQSPEILFNYASTMLQYIKTTFSKAVLAFDIFVFVFFA